MTDVDRCEREPNLSYKINVQIPENLARYCAENKCRLIHISTDQVFDGRADKYNESSTPNPINVYGKNKLEAEQKIQQIMRHNYLILRTNFFGINCLSKQSLSEWVIDSLKQGQEINMFADVDFNPLLVNTLVDLINRCTERKLTGLYDCGSDRKISKCEFGRLIKRIFILPGKIRKITVKQKRLVAKRPMNMYLDNDRLKLALGIDKLEIENELVALHELYQQGYPGQLKARYVKN